MSEKLPLERLKEKYIPIDEYPRKYGISVSKCMSLLREGKVHRAEFNKPGSNKRSIHLNYEEVLAAVGRS